MIKSKVIFLFYSLCQHLWYNINLSIFQKKNTAYKNIMKLMITPKLPQKSAKCMVISLNLSLTHHLKPLDYVWRKLSLRLKRKTVIVVPSIQTSQKENWKVFIFYANLCIIMLFAFWVCFFGKKTNLLKDGDFSFIDDIKFL